MRTSGWLRLAAGIVALGALTGCGFGVFTYTVTFANPSYDYTCVPIIDGEEQDEVLTTSSRSFVIEGGPHTFNIRFFENGELVEEGTPTLVTIDGPWEVKCWQFTDD